MNKKSKDQKQGEKTYQIRPQFKDKFRPQVSIKLCLTFCAGSERENWKNC
jgi:hypothetical protein